MSAGLGGLFGFLALVVMLPIMLLSLVGWWLGKRAAFLSLTLRGASSALLVLALIPLLFWYPSIGIFIEPESARFSKDFLGHAGAYWDVLLFSLIPACVSAAISWVLNLDEYQSNKRTGTPE